MDAWGGNGIWGCAGGDGCNVLISEGIEGPIAIDQVPRVEDPELEVRREASLFRHGQTNSDRSIGCIGKGCALNYVSESREIGVHGDLVFETG